MSLVGKTAVITGGRRGIGLAYCERMAVEGAHVVIIDREDATPLLPPLPGLGEKLPLICDVGKPAEVEACAARVLSQFGRCDIFVNNAAFMPMTTLDNVTSELWRRVQAINVEPIIHFAKAFVPGMAAAVGGGS
jgi:NAD(P)-dependent dehydrogenase (short-subunit alcohol dehydrogenase family)